MKPFTYIVDAIYPRRCPICHDIAMPRGNILCESCKEKLRFLREPRCKKCSKMLMDEQEEYCFDCRRATHFYDEGYSIFPYDSQMQQSIIRFKFYGRREYGVFYGQMILRLAGGVIARWKPTVMIPIPLHRKRQRRRGYNQSEIIGRVLSKGFSIPIRTDLVKRVIDTKAQKKLDRKERKRNLFEAFEIEAEVKKYHSVLLVDDVYTTGSTIDAVAVLLKKQGVKEVYFITVCIGRGF